MNIMHVQLKTLEKLGSSQGRMIAPSCNTKALVVLVLSLSSCVAENVKVVLRVVLHRNQMGSSTCLGTFMLICAVTYKRAS